MPGDNAFENRPGIHVCASLKIPWELPVHCGSQILQPGEEDVVIIIAPGVARNPAAGLV